MKIHSPFSVQIYTIFLIKMLNLPKFNNFIFPVSKNYTQISNGNSTPSNTLKTLSAP